MRVRIGQQDERLIVPLPKPLADQIALRKGSEVILTLEGGRLVLTPLSNGGQSLDELLAWVTAANLHDETSTGPVVGRESW